MLVFVTVGSTKFDALVQAAISKPVLDELEKKGYTRMVLQRGHSDLGKDVAQDEHRMQIETWKFKPTIQADIERADLVVSHAGSGTILDVLRSGKPLIVVPNPDLLDNHQEELASKLDGLGHLKATSISGLVPTIKTFEPNALIPFPAFDGSKFRTLVDEEMGFI
ncbi:glycosyltransferase 28 [Phlebopus sp. FC_14]|nr:glycosyltransferase 28 [Phlebopus sp. FC_14]